MTTEALSVTTTAPALADAVFTVLAHPASHAVIDGTGWVCEPLDGERLTKSGQVFRMAMDHANHPDGRYVMANQVRELDPPRAISWEPGTEDAEGRLSFGGWIWRYELAPAANGATQVRLTYDWSSATPQAREVIAFPPFGVEHLENSLRRLAVLATAQATAQPGAGPTGSTSTRISVRSHSAARAVSDAVDQAGAVNQAGVSRFRSA